MSLSSPRNENRRKRLGKKLGVPAVSRKMWEKDQVALDMQDLISELPTANPAQTVVKLKALDLYFKLRGFYGKEVTVPEPNVFLVPTSESDEIWKQKILEQQRELRRKTAEAIKST